MTRFVLAILSLPLAFAVGCGDPTNSNGGNTECTIDCDDTEFAATLRSIAPYGWVGDHYVWAYDDHYDDPACTGVGQCDALIVEANTYGIDIQGDTFMCVSQTATVNEDGEVIEVSSQWTAEGICGLAPDGDYGTYDVSTEVGSINGFDQVWVNFGNGVMAPITGADFFYEDTERLLEGTVSEDLTIIEYHLVVYNEDGSVYNEAEGVLTLQD